MALNFDARVPIPAFCPAISQKWRVDRFKHREPASKPLLERLQLLGTFLFENRDRRGVNPVLVSFNFDSREESRAIFCSVECDEQSFLSINPAPARKSYLVPKAGAPSANLFVFTVSVKSCVFGNFFRPGLLVCSIYLGTSSCSPRGMDCASVCITTGSIVQQSTNSVHGSYIPVYHYIKWGNCPRPQP